MEKLESLLVVRREVIGRTLVDAELVDDRLKTTKQVLNRLTRPLCEILIFTPVSLKQPGFDLSCPLMMFSEGSPDLTSRVQMAHPLKLSIPNSSKKHVDCFTVCFEQSHLGLCCSLIRDHIGSILGDIPYVATLAQQIRFHAHLPIVVSKGFQRWGFPRMRHGRKLT